MEFSPEQVKLIVESYSRELVATILDLMELSGSSERLLNAVRQSIYDKRDITLMKFNVTTKGNARNDKETYHKNYNK